jgi:hypothetical protein
MIISMSTSWFAFLGSEKYQSRAVFSFMPSAELPSTISRKLSAPFVFGHAMHRHGTATAKRSNPRQPAHGRQTLYRYPFAARLFLAQRAVHTNHP